MELVECVPNVSEGRRLDIVQQFAAAIQSVSDTQLLDVHSDPDHNRSVLTFAGPAGPVAEAAYRLAGAAVSAIDLRSHRGVHPRMGALDVLPFVPLGDTSMERCVALAHEVGRRIADQLQIPVYFYGQAALRPERRLLVDVRRGEFEGLAESIQMEASRAPDAGPSSLGPAGATAVGARPPLVAFNVLLPTDDLALARGLSRAVRASSGGLPGVQALAFRTSDPNRMQVSMNLFDLATTSVVEAVTRVTEEARRRDLEVDSSELVGLIPLSEVERAASVGMDKTSLGCGGAPAVGKDGENLPALLAAAACALKLPRLEANQVIELALAWK